MSNTKTLTATKTHAIQFAAASLEKAIIAGDNKAADYWRKRARELCRGY